jgi:hypothetical protein
MTITGKLIEDTARLLQNIELGAARASELALEVERLNTAVREASVALDFDAEPSSFFAVLAGPAS